MKVVEVPGAMQEILRRHKKNMKKDAKYRHSYDQLCERQAKALARDFRKGSKALEDLRSIPGFKEEEDELRVKNAMQLAIYEAKRRSGLKQFDALAGEDRQVVVSTRRGVNPPR